MNKAQQSAKHPLKHQGGPGRAYPPPPVHEDNRAQCEIQPEREIPARVSHLFELTDVLSGRIVRISSRLENVIVSRPHGTDSCGAAPSSTALGEQLAQISARLELMIEALESLDAQLEL